MTVIDFTEDLQRRVPASAGNLRALKPPQNLFSNGIWKFRSAAYEQAPHLLTCFSTSRRSCREILGIYFEYYLSHVTEIVDYSHKIHPSI